MPANRFDSLPDLVIPEASVGRGRFDALPDIDAAPLTTAVVAPPVAPPSRFDVLPDLPTSATEAVVATAPVLPVVDGAPVGMTADDEAKAIQGAPDWLHKASTAFLNTAKGFVPTTPGQAVDMLTPWGTVKDGYEKFKMFKDVLSGVPLPEAMREHIPLAREMADAEKTAPWSQERWNASFNLLGQLGMSVLMVKGIKKQMADHAPGASSEAAFRQSGEAPTDPQVPLSPEGRAPSPDQRPVAQATDLSSRQTGQSSPEQSLTSVEPSTFSPDAKAAERNAEYERMSANLDRLNTNEPTGTRSAEPVPAAEGSATVGAADGGIAPETIAGDVARPVGATTDVHGFGPGAASAKEKLASYEQRRFGKRFQADETIAPEIRAETGNQYYEPISNKTTFQDALNVIEERGTEESIRLVRDDTFQMEPRVRATVAQALIKKLNQSHKEAAAAGDTVRAEEFLHQSVDTAEYASGLGTLYGQGVQAFAIWDKIGPEGFVLEAKRLAKKSGADLTPEQTKKVAELAEAIEQAPEGFQRNEKTMEMLNFMENMKGIDPVDVPVAMYYANILSGYSTQLVNTIDTGINVLAESAAMAASHPTAIPQILGGLYRGMRNGAFEAASVLRTGKGPVSDKVSHQRVLERVKFGEAGGVPMNEKTALGRFMKAALETKVAKPLNLWKYPLRAMVASDTVMFHSMKEARARVLARVLGRKEGLSGADLFHRVEEILNHDPATRDAAAAQATTEGLTGWQAKRRAAEIVEQGRPEDLVGSASEAAEIATYNHDPSGVLGLVAARIADITEGFKPAKAIVPFTRIVANVTNRGLDYTPWGYKRLFFGQWGGKGFSTEPPLGEGFRTQLVKATLGTTAMATVGVLDAAGIVQVTANGPEDLNERKQLQNAGWKPYSVKVGDTYYSYQYTPLNLGFAMMGHYRDAVRYNKLDEKDAQTRLAYGMLKSASTIFDMSFLSGVSDFIETVQGATSSTKGASRLLTRTVTSMIIPNLVKQIDKLFDPTIYQADTVQQALVRETPIARMGLKPMLNVLGEPIQPSQNRFFTFKSDDRVWNLIVDKQAWVPTPSKTTKIHNRAITPEEYYRLVQMSGPRIRSYIERNLSRFERMPAEKVQDEIRDKANEIRTSVKHRL